MAILIPAGSSHDESGSLSFTEAMATPGYFDPPDTSREDAGRRINAAVKLFSDAVEIYRAAVLADAGIENADARVQVNVRNAVRRFSNLAEIFGL